MKPGICLVWVWSASISCHVTSDTTMPIVAVFIAPTGMPAPVLWSMTSPRIVAGIPAQFQRAGTISQTAASFGGKSRRTRRGLVEEVDMSRTVVDAVDLERKVKDMYTQVALDPHGQFHFEMGRAMARRLGYTDAELDAAPATRDYGVHRVSLLAIRN